MAIEEPALLSSNALIYLGKRGGGAQLTLELVQDLSRDGCTFEVILADDFEHDAKTNILGNVIYLPGIHNTKLIFSRFFHFLKSSWLVSKKFKSSSELKVCIVMIQPLDLFFISILKINNRKLKIMTIIHEVESRGKGMWPNSRIVRLYAACSTRVVVLNETFPKSKALSNFKGKIIQSTLSHRNLFPEEASSKVENRYYLCIGRGDEYKDYDLLLEAWDIAKIPEVKLIVAGENLPNMVGENIVLVNNWLTDKAFMKLIQDSSVVIFPYKSNSQSGVLSLCLSIGKSFVITPVPELTEQARGYGNTSIDFSPEGLARAMIAASKMTSSIHVTPIESEEILLHHAIFNFFNGACEDGSTSTVQNCND